MAGVAEEPVIRDGEAVASNASAADHYSGIAAYFDDFARVEARWRRRNA